MMWQRRLKARRSWTHWRRLIGACSQPTQKGDETLDALFHGKVKLFQSRSGYRFSLDALLLAHFVALKARESAIDLGTGNGVIPLILARLHNDVAITGVEIQPAMAERAARNVRLNQLESQIHIRLGDIREVDANRAGGELRRGGLQSAVSPRGQRTDQSQR
jgi:tRNA1(Val) A37 N6-methylase TrmN6